MTPQDEATELLSEVVAEITSLQRDLKTILRKCQHICELLDWKPQGSWFHQELGGYYPNSSLPAHRKIRGKRIWEIQGSAFDKAEWMSERMAYDLDPTVYTEEEDVLEVWAGIDWFLAGAQAGYRESTPETKDTHSPSGKKEITLRRVRVFAVSQIAASLSEIEKRTFDFASKAYVQLKYGSTIGDIWSEYRRQVEAALKQLELTDHLNAIQSSLQSDNPELWRTGVLECRNLLHDLANYLWRDRRPTYHHLPGKALEGKLETTEGKFGNRLAAYIHQKGITGTRGRYLRDEAERLADSIQSIIAFQSEAHEPITLQDARSVALGTYILIGELVTRTDLQPVLEYGEPTLKNS